MASAKAICYPDLCMLIDSAEDRSETTGEGYSGPAPFDPDEFVGVLQMQYENLKCLRMHSNVHFEHQKQEMAKENEASFLEALKQSVEYFESDHHFSALNPMSSTIDDPFMLEEIIPSQFGDNYSKEEITPGYFDCGLNKVANVSHKENHVKSHCNTKKAHSPFIELQKHVDNVDGGVEKVKSSNVASAITGTRLVNTKRYAKKYGAVDERKRLSSMQEPPVKRRRIKKQGSVNESKIQPSVEKPRKRIVIHPVISCAKKEQRCSKLLTTVGTSKPCTTARVSSGKKPPNASIVGLLPNLQKNAPSPPMPTASSNIAAPVQPCKRLWPGDNAAVSEKVPVARPTAKPPHDHDYCTSKDGSSKEDTVVESAPADIESAKGEGKLSTQKVLKLQDYLKQVREGIRSGPCSPAGSPKVVTGPTKQVNNFMAVTEQVKRAPSNSVCKTVGITNSVVPLPAALRKSAIKQTFGLQEFDKYMNGLQTNLNSSKPGTCSPPTTPSVAVSHSPLITEKVPAIYATSTQRKNDALSSLAAARMVHATETLRQKSKNEQTNCNLPAGTSGQLLTVKVPMSSRPVASHVSKIAVKTKSSISRQNSLPVDPRKNSTPTSKPAVSQCRHDATQFAPSLKSTVLTKDAEILSGIATPLKEILTLMAQKQAKLNAESNARVQSSNIQWETSQKISSCTIAREKNSAPTVETTLSAAQDTACLKGQTSSNTTQKHPKAFPSAPEHESLTELDTNVVSLLGVKETSETRELERVETSMENVSNTDCCSYDSSSFTPSNASELTATDNTANLYPQSEKVNEQLSNPITPVLSEIFDSQPSENVNGEPAKAVLSNPVREKESQRKFSMTRSMAAAEMMASDVVNDGTEEVMFYTKPIETNKAGKGGETGDQPEVDNDPAVISLEEALDRLENDEILGQHSSRVTSQSAADNIFCELPSYFLTGKPVLEGEWKFDALKDMEPINVHHPHVSVKTENVASVEFHKSLDYLSSGKARPSSSTSDGQKAPLAKCSGGSDDFSAKYHSVGNSQRSTSHGNPVNTSETHFSELPSYHTKSHSSKLGTHSKRRQSSKKKKHKRKRTRDIDRCPEKVSFSKLPSYYTSGQHFPNYGEDPRRKYVRSPSPRSRYPPNRSRSRSPLRRSCRRGRYSSRSYSRSLSRSSSDSGGESARSWRRERGSCRSRRDRSYDQRSYNSSDEEHDEFVRCRENEANRARQEHRNAEEKEKQRAIEERRVVYVGGIDRQTTKSELRRRFLRFGNIETVTLHFRNDGDNYGFLTFQYTCDAFRAIEEGSDLGPGEPRYNLCFGGRRQFCASTYRDLDGKADRTSGNKTEDLDDFDALLRQSIRNIRR